MVSLLIVDDEPMVVQTLQMQLSSLATEGVWIEGALSGQEALELIPKLPAPLAVVIADYLMPGLKGDDLLIEIHRWVPQAQLILLTGQAEAHNVGKIINHAPLYRYIAKPWDPTDLVLTVREALRVYYLERAYEALTQTLEERLQAQNQTLLAATPATWVQRVSHDLKGPLSGLKQLATLLQEQPTPPEKVQNTLPSSLTPSQNWKPTCKTF
jgi:DNA-binding NtrC family response regulator